MAKAKNKTVPTRFTAEEYLANIKDEARQNDCQKILDMMQEISGDAPKEMPFASALVPARPILVFTSCLAIRISRMNSRALVNTKLAKPASILNGYQMWMKAF